MSFSSFNLSDPVLQGLHAAGFHNPTEIQSSVIPLILEGKDIAACSPTGTGKTAAFILPVMEMLCSKLSEGILNGFPQVLLLAPTREIAIQNAEFVQKFENFTKIQTAVFYGGEKIKKQYSDAIKRIDFIIATPGRLIDLIHRKMISLSHVKILLIDEADKMIDMGFIADIRKITKYIPFNRQTLLFSATMKNGLRTLMREIQNKAVFIQTGQISSPVQSVHQYACFIPQHLKPALLTYIIKAESLQRVLVFVNTKQTADRLHHTLNRSTILSEILHSEKSMAFRQKALQNFKNGQCPVLVSTELAARGIDVNNISWVINYDTPITPQSYIHRIGRTGRFQSKGTALTFYSENEEVYIKRIQYYTGNKVQLKKYPEITG